MNDLLGYAHGRVLVLAQRVAFLGVLAILIIAGLTVADILLRWLARGSVPGFNEILAMGMAVAISATFPAGAIRRVNLAVDLVAARLGPVAVRWMRVSGALFMLVLYGFLLWSLIDATLDLDKRNAATVILQMPQPPFLWSVAGLLGLATLAQIVVVFAAVREALAGIEWTDSEALGETANASGGAREGLGAGFGLIAFALLVGAGAVAIAAYHGIALAAATARASPEATALVLFGVMWVLVFLLVPLAAAMGLVGLVGTALLLGTEPAVAVFGTVIVEYLTSDQLAVLPLFLIMGSFAGVAGLAQDIYDLAHTFLGHRRGGLALATIGGCAGFGTLTGSSIATTATIGQVALPEMQSRGYSASLSTGCVAAGGTLGQLVPPSTALILYALLTEESIGQLFIGAIVPAVIAVALYCGAIVLFVRLSPGSAPAAAKGPTLREVLTSVRRSWGVVFLVGIVIGGIYGGVFTVTEAAAVGAGLAFLFALFRGKLRGGALLRVVGETTATTAMLYVMFFGAVTFSYFIGLSGLPENLTALIKSLDLPHLLVIAVILVIFLFLGCIMDSFAVMVITVPILAPYITDIGYSLIWWGILNLIVVETGMITPPFGLNVFILKSLLGSDVPMTTVFRGVLPFVTADVLKLVLIVIFPALVLWLPSSMVR